MDEQQTTRQPDALRIAQLTDTHVYADPAGTLLGLNTRRCLEEVMALLLRSRRPDMIVASGDLSHDGSPESYAAVRACFSTAAVPVYCLPGNHDEGRVLRQSMNQAGFFSVRSHCSHGWQQVFLDSTVDGADGGHLSAQELQALDAALAAHSGSPALVWLHHQPLPMGSRWLDTMAVDNPQDFFDVIDRHPDVRAVIWGHVHQVYDGWRNGVRLLATPSTCLQFLPGSETFGVEEIPPGYRWLELHRDGRLETGVERLAQVPGTIDLSARGY